MQLPAISVLTFEICFARISISLAFCAAAKLAANWSCALLFISSISFCICDHSQDGSV